MPAEPRDFEPYGERKRLTASDCSSGCKWFHTLSGPTSKDGGSTAIPESLRRAPHIRFSVAPYLSLSRCFLMSRGVFLRPVMILFCLRKKRLEAVINLSQFPENRNKQNCDHEQQELESHFLAFRGKELETCRHSTTRGSNSGECFPTHEFIRSARHAIAQT
jgi:hypothetical protein